MREDSPLMRGNSRANMRGESARPGKRPLRALSATEKMEAIQRVHEGESKASVARDIGVPESTLRGWCKSEHKIRGMARNSSTPESEAHSPASSSGTNLAATATAATTTHSSEDETGPAAKRARIDQSMGSNIPSSYGVNENSENGSRLDTSNTFDYMTLMASMATMRPENSALLLQHMSMLSNAGAANNFAKSFLSLQAGLAHSSTVGLVENGLQYTKATNKPSRHSTSAIAPTQIDSKAKTGVRKSLPAAAEAPVTPAPVSPRITHDTATGTSRMDATNNKNDNSSPSMLQKTDDPSWNWLCEQQQLLEQQSKTFDPSISPRGKAWFWRLYKENGLPFPPATPIPATAAAKKSPSKKRAHLDLILCHNNNNENVRRSLNMGAIETDSHRVDVQPPSTDEAIQHGEKFVQWLDTCSDPSVSWLNVTQFKYLLGRVKSRRLMTSAAALGYRQGRK